jgi:Ig-like domain from next to BRCA1 gene
MIKFRKFLAPLLFLMITSMACGLPGIAQPTEDGNQLITEAAKTVEFQLTQGAINNPGTATPLVRPPTVTLPPTDVVNPTNTPQPPPPTAVPCDQVTFISDVTVPDGSKLSGGQTFTKKWLLKNTGSCTWTTSYAAVFSSGEKMGAPNEVNLTGNVAPGQTMELAINMTAPAATGKYQGNWKLHNQNGTVFGLPNGLAFYVSIEVVQAAVTQTPVVGNTVVYDFASDYCSAAWSSEAGALSCPGGLNDDAGFIIRLDNPILANGNAAGGASLETAPLMKSNSAWNGNGSIQGEFPSLSVDDGYHFLSQIACLKDATTCNVNFHLNYSADSGPLQSLGSWSVSYNSGVRSLNIDLGSLSGSDVVFYLSVDAASDAGTDSAVWVTPRIVK